MDVSRREAIEAAGALSAAAMASTAALTGTAAAGQKEDKPDKPGHTPHTKFAVNIEMWWTKLPTYEDRIKKTAELGFPAVEFWPFENKKIPELAELCKSLGVAVAQFTAWGFFPGLNDPKNHKRFLEKIEAGCKAAKILDCKLMTVVGGNDVRGMTQEQMHKNIIDGLKAAAPIVEAHGVTIILEPMNIRVDHKGHCLYGSEAAVRICRAVGSPNVKINWDLYHMHITEGDLCRRLKEGWDQVGYLQLADNPGRNEPGTGEIHYPRVLKEAWDLGYRGYVGLECRPKKDELTAAWNVYNADWR